MKVASLAAGALLFAACMVPAAARDQVSFIKKPAPMGAAVSTVTTFRPAAGRVVNCSGRCFSDGVTRHWQCRAEPGDIVHCQLHCSPPQGECLFE